MCLTCAHSASQPGDLNSGHTRFQLGVVVGLPSLPIGNNNTHTSACSCTRSSNDLARSPDYLSQFWTTMMFLLIPERFTQINRAVLLFLVPYFGSVQTWQRNNPFLDVQSTSRREVFPVTRKKVELTP